MVKQFDEAQLQGCIELFRSMPTFQDDPDGGTVQASDLPAIIDKIGFNRNTKEKQDATTYAATRKVNQGIIPFAEFIGVCKIQHDPVAFAKFEAQLVDLDGDGFISKEEFEALLSLLIVHEPLLKGIEFEQFLNEADTNKDGKVSIDEAGKWIEINLNGRTTPT